MPSRNTESHQPTSPDFSRFTWLVAGVLVGVGLVAIGVWAAGYSAAFDAFPGTGTVTVHASAALVAAGIALALQEAIGSGLLRGRRATSAARIAAAVLALAIFLLGAFTLVEHIASLGIDAGMDGWLTEPVLADGPGLMSVPAAVSVVLAGIALMMLDLRLVNGHYIAEYLAILMLAFMAVPLVGYLSSTIAHNAPPWQGVGPQTAVLFMLLATGLLTARPQHKVMALWNSDGPGAALVRNLLPKSLLLLLVLELLVDYGARGGMYEYEKVSPLLLLLAGVWMSVLFWRAGALLNREHEERRSREMALSETSALLRAVSDNTPDAIYVKDHAGRIVFANPATARLLGLERADLIGLGSEDLFADPEDAATVDANDRAVMQRNAPIATEESVHLPDGVRTLYSTKTPWLDHRGRVAGVIGISTDITARKRDEEALRRHESQLEKLVQERTAEVSELIGHIEATREEEKRAIARELHDDLGSALTALSMHLAILFQKMPPDPVLAERSRQIKALLGSVTQTTRRIQVGLRPDKLDIFGIKTAISEQCLEFEKYSGVTCNADLPDEDISYEPALEIGLFRMVQEGLNNVAKHAKATRVDVVLDDTGDEILLGIRDNGVGFAPAAAAGRLTHGLRGMRERAQYLGGEVRITSAPNKGTQVSIRLPRKLAQREQGDEHLRQAG